MLTISVSNIKGGSGKTTIATNLAAWLAGRGLATALGDLDPQHGALGWLARRPGDRPTIKGFDLAGGDDLPKKKPEVLVVDGVAAMRRKDSRDLVRDCDCLLIPVLPSILDEDGTRRFLDQIAGMKTVRKGKRRIGFIANRVKPRSHAATRLAAFLAAHDFPTVATLRETGLYGDAALRGLGIGELTGRRAAPYQDEWTPLIEFLLAT